MTCNCKQTRALPAEVPGRLSIYRIMDDQLLEAAIVDLERITSQPGFRLAPPSTRHFYLEKLSQASNEIQRRRT